MYKQDFENITAAVISKENQYLKYENAEEIYKNVVTHGPLDIKLLLGNTNPKFNN